MYYRNFVIITPWKRAEPFILKKKPWIPFIQECFVPSLVEIGTAVLEKKIFKSCQCNFTILQLSPLEKRNSPSIEQIWIFLAQGCFVPIWLYWPSGSGEEDFLNTSMYFSYSKLSPLWNRAGPSLNLNKLESPLPKDALCQVWLKLAQWFWRRRFLNFINVFSLFV